MRHIFLIFSRLILASSLLVSSNIYAANDSSTFNHLPSSKQKVMTQLPQTKYDTSAFSNMSAIDSFIANSSNDCDNINSSTDIQSKPNYCFKVLSVVIGESSTTGTIQCPQGYTLLLTTSSSIKYINSNGNTVTNSTVDYTNSSTKSDITSSTVIDYYEDNLYSCSWDTNDWWSETGNLQELYNNNAKGKTYDNVLDAACGSSFDVNSVTTYGGKYTKIKTKSMTHLQCKRKYWGAYYNQDDCWCYCYDADNCGGGPGGWSTGSDCKKDWGEGVDDYFWNAKCHVEGYYSKCTRPAGYYFNDKKSGNSEPSGASLPNAAVNPITGTSASICGKIVYDLDYWIESQDN